MDRKTNSRMRVVSLRTVGQDKGGELGDTKDVVGIGLGYRVVYSEQAEIWTVSGILRDGSISKEHVGELSFVIIPGDMEPAAAVTGFIAPKAPYALAMTDDAIWQQIRSMVVQLGYDQEGFYASYGVGGRLAYFEDYPRR